MKRITIDVEQFVHDRLTELQREIKAEIGAEPNYPDLISGLIWGTPAGQAAAMIGACSRHGRDLAATEEKATEDESK